MVGHLQQENGQLKAKLRGGVAEVRVTIVTVIIVTVPIITVIFIIILIMITPPTLNTGGERNAGIGGTVRGQGELQAGLQELLLWINN